MRTRIRTSADQRAILVALDPNPGERRPGPMTATSIKELARAVSMRMPPLNKELHFLRKHGLVRIVGTTIEPRISITAQGREVRALF